MKTTAWKNIDVEVEVDVTTEQIIEEFQQRRDELEDTYWRRFVEAVAVMIRIIESTPDSTLAKIPAATRQVVQDHLKAEAARWGPEQ